MKRLTLTIAALTIAIASAAQPHETDTRTAAKIAADTVATDASAYNDMPATTTAAATSATAAAAAATPVTATTTTATATATAATPASAAAEEPSTVKKSRFLPMRNRVDRETHKHSFVYKGELMIGATVSYGTLSSDNTDLYLLLDNLKLGGSVVTVNPFIGYFVADNHAIGLRFGYTRVDGRLGNATLDLGEQNDVQMSFGNMDFRSNNYSFGIYHRSYAPLDAKGRFGLFSELELLAVTGSQTFGYTSGGERQESNSDIFRIKLNFNPGLAVYIFPNVCGTVSFGLGGIQYNRISQSDETGAFTGLRQTSKMQFKLNLTDIRVGMTIHLWNKKKQ